MSDLLFLVQRIPYPPTKGEKIRHYRFLHHLAGRFRVHLGCFIDDPADWLELAPLRRLCADAHFASIDRRMAKVACLRGLLTGTPLSCTYFWSGELDAWVDQVLARVRPAVAVMCSSVMGQYLVAKPNRPLRLVMDFCDVDADKWDAYARTTRWPASAIYRRESRRLLAFDRAVAEDVDAAVFVSEPEADLFRRLAPESAAKVVGIANGVDFDYFSPDRDYPAPYDTAHPVFVFTGTMDYWPNVDAVEWFARTILPSIRVRSANAAFYIVGANPSPAVRALARLPGVRVTGRVPDVRPYLAHARAAVAPLRIARGLQNKVLEAMAMGRPVIVTPQALEGIEAEPETDLILAATAPEFAKAALRLFDGDLGRSIGAAARRKVLASYGWSARLAALDGVIDGTMAPAQGGPSETLPT